MARDIKKMFENYTPESSEIPSGHEARFEAKLNKAFSEDISEEKKASIPWLKIAAVAIVFFAVCFFGYQQLSRNSPNTSTDQNNTLVEGNSEISKNPQLTLADISPDLKKLQEFYMTGINMQLASLKIDDGNRELVDGYMQMLAELDKEYSALNAELTKVGQPRLR